MGPLGQAEPTAAYSADAMSRLLVHLRGAPVSFVRAEYSEIFGEREEHALEGTVVRELCHGALLPHDRYVSEPLSLMHVSNARVHVRWGFVQVEPARFLEESVHASRWFSPRLSELPRDPIPATGKLPGVVARGERDLCDPAPPRRTLHGAHLLLGHWAAHNYGHFFMDCLPAVFQLRDRLRRGDLSLLARPLAKWQREVLARMGVLSALREVEDDVVSVERLLFPNALTCCYMTNPSSLHRAMFEALSLAGEGPERIYVSRAGRAGSRAMVNEAELVRALESRGFVAIEPGELSIEEQARRFSRARILVGALGAGLTNIGYAPAGCAVVEVLPERVTETWTAHFCKVLGHRFVHVIAPVHKTNEVVVAGRARDDMAFEYETPLAPTLAAVDALLTARPRSAAGGG